MKKQTKVLLAAAMMTMGATFSAMAATKGTWVLNEEGWQYADKDGDYVDNEWCKSNGIEYWINDDEVLGGSEWVYDDENDRYYYAQSDGSKAINTWKYLYSFNDEDEEEDQHWYYFDAKGRMLKNTKKTINGSTYHFNANGEMLTGWIEELKEDEADADKVTGYEALDQGETTEFATIYTDENGAVVKSSWINVFPWDKADPYEGEHEEWYYTTSAGKVTTGKKDINGLTYIFGADGKMLTEWVGKAHGATTFAEIDTDETAASSANFAEIYYLDAENGYVKKNGWRYLENASGSDDYWFHFDKLGRAFLATDADAEDVIAVEQVFANGEKNAINDKTDKDGNVVEVMVTSKKIDGVVYYFNANGEMIDGLQMIGGKVYFLEDGARQTGKVTLTDENENDYTFYFGEKTEDIVEKYVAVTGAYKNYIYVDGQLITSDDSDSYKLVEGVNGHDYIVDNNGKIQHKDGKDYGVGAGKFFFDDEDDFITGPYTEDAE